jgi:BASS family bile acid:Na+ symporter
MVSIFAFMFSRGLRTRPGDLWYFRARPGLLFRSLFSVDMLVPLIAVIVIFLVRPAKATAAGLLILASSPAAPLVFKKISKSGGEPEYAVSLHIVLASLAIITTPVTLELLSSATDFQFNVSPLAVAARVGLSILLPIIAGIAIRWLFPALARHLIQPLEALSNIILILVLMLVLLFSYRLLFMPDIRSIAAIVLMVVGALVSGHLMASGSPREQSTLALESSTRNIGLALLMASDFASLEQALPVLVPYVVTSMVVGFIYVRYCKIGRDTRSTTGLD